VVVAAEGAASSSLTNPRVGTLQVTLELVTEPKGSSSGMPSGGDNDDAVGRQPLVQGQDRADAFGVSEDLGLVKGRGGSSEGDSFTPLPSSTSKLVTEPPLISELALPELGLAATVEGALSSLPVPIDPMDASSSDEDGSGSNEAGSRVLGAVEKGQQYGLSAVGPGIDDTEVSSDDGEDVI
jgi:hypothetical protein